MKFNDLIYTVMDAFGEVIMTCAAQTMIANARLLMTRFAALLALGFPTQMHCKDQAETRRVHCHA